MVGVVAGREGRVGVSVGCFAGLPFPSEVGSCVLPPVESAGEATGLPLVLFVVGLPFFAVGLPFFAVGFPFGAAGLPFGLKWAWP